MLGCTLRYTLRTSGPPVLIVDLARARGVLLRRRGERLVELVDDVADVTDRLAVARDVEVGDDRLDGLAVEVGGVTEAQLAGDHLAGDVVDLERVVVPDREHDGLADLVRQPEAVRRQLGVTDTLRLEDASHQLGDREEATGRGVGDATGLRGIGLDLGELLLDVVELLLQLVRTCHGASPCCYLNVRLFEHHPQ